LTKKRKVLDDQFFATRFVILHHEAQRVDCQSHKTVKDLPPGGFPVVVPSVADVVAFESCKAC
jgi:hypothetical protein